jgi:predicted regulator of Ras-like GTPase activity (Roadblock/LC7/MglB family)
MQAIMLGLTSVPGVMGGMLSDERGNVLAHSFPPYFDAVTIKGAADLLQDNTVGLQDITGGIKLFDIRFELGRLIIKTLPHMFVVILCQPSVNIQLLFISLNVAVKKLEKLSIAHPLVQAAQQAAPQVQIQPVADVAPRPVVSAPAYSDYRAVTDAKGVLLTCETMKKTAGTFWESMTDNASVNRNTALEISNFFGTGPFKKLTVTNRTTGISKHVPISVIQHDRDHVYDGKIILTQSLTELLNVNEGDQIRVEVVVGGGILGWEGI